MVRESSETVLAKNLVAARIISGMTQHELAAAADVSRATVAQLEAGLSDPRLSTVAALAKALGIAPMSLLASGEEVDALVGLAAQSVAAPPRADVTRLRFLLESGMLKDRVRAARAGAALARELGYAQPAEYVTAGLFAAIQPGAVSVGAELGKRLSPKAE